MKMVIYTDGGARGNPGPAAIGIIFLDLNKEYGEAIGEATNNVAEYRAVVFALKKAKQLLGKKSAEADIEIRSDSELIVNQLSGKYKVKDADLKEFFVDVWNLKQDFGSVLFTHIPREKNKKADWLVNKTLNTLI
ncbi:hypothetical protein A3D55_00015 [Candidatus Jorgensenbacteria bacterium RIFCSPHIGHO2_02_FULL_45_20]|uniref:RNase H type-1 domain-containing protein n=1 Tax=Candidatus Jorgensenbacteria bacterium RIFCSPHIGHO2_02_FULL_45_20 TaxID=1798470 RepID=A0A1F6BNY1_9BACT|nr:MAG: hypothetical protein A3D55_00015 [Candidatus Jorgensenbacteria bacterium RIFCSPHIGHO2_02_FULL_45_20]